MTQVDAKTVLEYLYDIPSALTMLRQEMQYPAHTVEQVRAMATRESSLMQDAETIRGCVLMLHSRYRKIIEMRYGEHRTWASISVNLYVPDSTVRHWHGAALTRIAECLDSVPDSRELVERAQLARL